MNYVFFLAVTIISGVLFTLTIRAWSIKHKIVNNPNPIIPQHIKPVAYLGGAGIFLGIFACILIAHLLHWQIIYKVFSEIKPLVAVGSGCILFLTLGIYDDLMQLKPLPKFLIQLFCSVVCVFLGLRVNIFQLQFFNFIFSVFWILVIVNAVNFIDVCDGLAGSICAITFLLIGILSHEPKIFCFLIAGVTIGFLFFNLPKASIFLGDAGSHLLGFLLAAVGITGTENLNTLDSIIWMLFIAIVPLFELIFITIVRIKKGKKWWKGSPDHFSLRMQTAGFERWQIDLIAACIAAIFVIVALMMPQMNYGIKYLFFAVTIIVFAFFWKVLLKWEVKPK